MSAASEIQNIDTSEFDEPDFLDELYAEEFGPPAPEPTPAEEQPAPEPTPEQPEPTQEQPAPEPKKRGRPKKKLTKKIMIERIRNMQEKIKTDDSYAYYRTDENSTISNLAKRKVAKLREIYDALRAIVPEIAEAEDWSSEPVPPAERKEAPERQPETAVPAIRKQNQDIVLEQLTGGAMAMSVLGASVIEGMTNYTAEYHGFEMEGYPNAIQAHEEALKDAYRKILEEEGSGGALSQALEYMNTPYLQLALVFGIAAQSCVKKKEDHPSMTSSPSSSGQ